MTLAALKKRAEKQVDKLRIKYPIGDTVRVRLDDGEICEWVVLGFGVVSCEAALYAEGIVGAYSASRIVAKRRLLIGKLKKTK